VLFCLFHCTLVLKRFFEFCSNDRHDLFKWFKRGHYPVVWEVFSISQDKTLEWQDHKIKFEMWFLWGRSSDQLLWSSPLEIILDEFLRSNQASFDKFQVRCGNLDEEISECEKKLVELETECHAMVVDEKSRLRSIQLYLKNETQLMGWNKPFNCKWIHILLYSGGGRVQTSKV